MSLLMFILMCEFLRDSSFCWPEAERRTGGHSDRGGLFLATPQTPLFACRTCERKRVYDPGDGEPFTARGPRALRLACDNRSETKSEDLPRPIKHPVADD